MEPVDAFLAFIKVVSIKDFGAFVSIEGSDRQGNFLQYFIEHAAVGLVHRTQISNYPVDNVADVLEVGEKIYVKIISDEVISNVYGLNLFFSRTER